MSPERLQRKEGKGKNTLWIILTAGVILAVVLCVFALAAKKFMHDDAPAAALVLYEGPKPIPASETVSMKVDGNELFVYETEVNNTHSWKSNYLPSLSTAPITSFDFDGAPVQMEITLLDGNSPEKVTVHPLAEGILPQVEGSTIWFEIEKPGVYTVEYDDNAMTAMYIFANAIDYDAPTESTDTVKYIGPGAWTIEDLSLTDGMELYISGGAVVQGNINAANADHIKISGHGFLDGSHNESWMLNGYAAYVPINLSKCTNADISGVAILDPNAWCVNLYQCSDVNIDGIKAISARPNGDGITIQSCQDVVVQNSFIRSWDDSLVVKNYAVESGSDSANITFDHCQVWSDLAQAMEIGYETNKGNKINPTIQNVVFQNITVLHSFHKPVMSIHNADNCVISNVNYSNIIVEDASMGKGDAGDNAQLIDINNLKSNWTTVPERGSISDITFDGVYVLDGDDTIDFIEGNFCPIRIQGFDEASLCSNIRINDLYLLGEAVTDERAGENPSTSIDRFTEDIHFTNSGEEPEFTGKKKKPDKRVNPNVTVISAPEQEEFEVHPEWVRPEEEPIDYGENIALGRAVSENGHTQVYHCRNINDGETLTYWEGRADDYPNEITFDMEEKVTISGARILLNPRSNWGARTQDVEIQISEDGENFTTAYPESTLSFDPDSGNYAYMELEAPMEAQYIRFIFYANTGATGGQAAEIEIYAPKE